MLLLKYCYGHIFILNRLLTKTLQQKRNNKIDQVFYFQENLNWILWTYNCSKSKKCVFMSSFKIYWRIYYLIKKMFFRMTWWFANSFCILKNRIIICLWKYVKIASTKLFRICEDTIFRNIFHSCASIIQVLESFI